MKNNFRFEAFVKLLPVAIISIVVSLVAWTAFIAGGVWLLRALGVNI